MASEGTKAKSACAAPPPPLCNNQVPPKAKAMPRTTSRNAAMKSTPPPQAIRDNATEGVAASAKPLAKPIACMARPVLTGVKSEEPVRSGPGEFESSGH
eukprot:1010755-Amphidinium_carterae.1